MKKLNDLLIENLSDISMTWIMLDEQSKSILESQLLDQGLLDKGYEEDWNKIKYQHVTVKFGELSIEDRYLSGKNVEFQVTKFGKSDMAIAAGVELVDKNLEIKNKIPHITVAVRKPTDDNPQGGKPVMSNDISNWISLNPFKLKGVVMEIPSSEIKSYSHRNI